MKEKTILIFVVLSVACISCRYEEGPLISFRPSNHRIAGDWKVESFTANGIDSMNYLRRYHLDGLWHMAPYHGDSDPGFSVTKDNFYKAGFWEESRDNHKFIVFSFYFVQNNHIQDWPFNYQWRII